MDIKRSRAIITHFDGDPFTLNYWLMLYEKFWRGEVDTIYMTVAHDMRHITQEVVDFNKRLIAKYPEIKAVYLEQTTQVEDTNKMSYDLVTEDYVGFIESDGLVCQKGLIDQMFRLLEHEKQDVVAPTYKLINEPYIVGDLHCEGFMRCFFFTKKSILDKIDVDFNPKHLAAGELIPNTNLRYEYNNDLDCFGWISLQIATLRPKVTIVPSNVLHPDTALNVQQYEQYKWLHIRQFSSSGIGLNTKEFGLWKNNSDELVAYLMRVISGDYVDGAAEFTFVKAVAFKMLFYESMPVDAMLGEFAQDYKTVLEAVVDGYSLPRGKIFEMKGFYKAITQL